MPKYLISNTEYRIPKNIEYQMKNKKKESLTLFSLFSIQYLIFLDIPRLRRDFGGQGN